MLIHQVETDTVIRHEVDPFRGHVAKRVEVLKQGTTSAIKFHDDREFEAVDGSFDLPEDVAAYFLGTPGWYAGASPFDQEVFDTNPDRSEVASEGNPKRSSGKPKVESKGDTESKS
jgi:hypothetical protein